MQPTDEKVQAYQSARERLAEPKDEGLRYVALDLRRCIEAVVYEKLEAYRKWISEKLARTWQPPQAFRALLEIDPGGENDSVIAVALQDRVDGPPITPLKAIGTDRRPSVKWLTETWNSLGADLHAGWPYSRKSKRGNRRDFYERVLAELEPFVSSHFTAAMTNVIEFKCSECGETVVISPQGLNTAGHATCLHCWLRYSHQEENGESRFFLEDPSIECPECKKAIYVPVAQLRDGYEFECRHCETRLRAVIETWGFQQFTQEPSEAAGSASEERSHQQVPHEVLDG
jgi:hypothetical protein